MKTLKILIVEDETGHIDLIEEMVQRFEASESMRVEVSVMTTVPLTGRLVHTSVEEKDWDYDVILLDLKVPISGDKTWAESKRIYGDFGGCLAAELIASSGSRSLVLIRSGFIQEWPDGVPKDGRRILEERNRILYYHKDGDAPLEPMLHLALRATADEKAFDRILHQKILFAARTDYPVLLLGETGTGKELVARSIHHHWSLRKTEESNGSGSQTKRPFLTVNCALLGHELLRDELMGHVKGSFTGAFQHKLGTILRAAGLSQGTPPRDNAEGGPDFGKLNLTHDNLVKYLDSLKKNPAQPLGTPLNAVRDFFDELDKAAEQTRRFLERIAQSAAAVGSDAFKKWLRALGGNDAMQEVRETDSSPLDLVYDNEHSYGTLFLDEIGYLDPATQGMLLRLLGSFEVLPVGYEGSIKLKHLRIIAATSNSRWLQIADGQRPDAAVHAELDEGPKADLYHRLAYHVIVLDGLSKKEVEPFIEAKGRAKDFWRSELGKNIAEEIKTAVGAGKFLGHRRELEKLVRLIEAYHNVLPLLGRDDTLSPREKLSWNFVASDLWYPQQRVGVYRENNNSTAQTDEDRQPKIDEDGVSQVAEGMKRKLEVVLTEYLGSGDWSGAFSSTEMKKIFNRVDATRRSEFRSKLRECVKLGRDGRSMDVKNAIAKRVVQGVKNYRALTDFFKP